MKNLLFVFSILLLGCDSSYKEPPYFILNPITRMTDQKAITNFCSVSEDGKLTFSSNKSGNFKLYIKNLEERAITQLTFGNGDDVFPSFSPCGKKIVFSSNRFGSFDIFIIDVEKKEKIRQITFDNKRDEIFPSFSPDGNKILFTLAEEKGCSIMLFDLKTELSTEITRGFYGRFSKDGNTILFNRGNGNDVDMWMVDINGKNERLIFHNEEFNAIFPSFSPSCSNIVYTACPKGRWKEFRFDNKIEGIKNLKMHIRVVDAMGGNDRRITGDLGLDAYPCWVSNFIYFSSQRGNIVDIFRVSQPEEEIEKVKEEIQKTREEVVIQEEKGKIKRVFKKPRELESKTEVVTTRDNVSIWSYPGKTVIANLDKGTKLIVIDASKKWYIKVLLPDGREGWISSFFVE